MRRAEGLGCVIGGGHPSLHSLLQPVAPANLRAWRRRAGGDDADDGALLALFRSIASGDDDEVGRRLDAARDLARSPVHTGANRDDTDAYFLTAIRQDVDAGDTTVHIAAAATSARVRELLGVA